MHKMSLFKVQTNSFIHMGCYHYRLIGSLPNNFTKSPSIGSTVTRTVTERMYTDCFFFLFFLLLGELRCFHVLTWFWSDFGWDDKDVYFFALFKIRLLFNHLVFPLFTLQWAVNYLRHSWTITLHYRHDSCGFRQVCEIYIQFCRTHKLLQIQLINELYHGVSINSVYGCLRNYKSSSSETVCSPF